MLLNLVNKHLHLYHFFLIDFDFDFNKDDQRPVEV